jgi:hypothetical protein
MQQKWWTIAGIYQPIFNLPSYLSTYTSPGRNPWGWPRLQGLAVALATWGGNLRGEACVAVQVVVVDGFGILHPRQFGVQLAIWRLPGA